jgi:hypothetical protein
MRRVTRRGTAPTLIGVNEKKSARHGSVAGALCFGVCGGGGGGGRGRGLVVCIMMWVIYGLVDVSGGSLAPPLEPRHPIALGARPCRMCVSRVLF